PTPVAFARLFSAVAVRSAAPRAAADEWIMYVGTYTRAPSKGIYGFRYPSAGGVPTSIGLAAETTNPSFLAIHPNQRFLYAVGEVENLKGKKTGGISAFAIDAKTGDLKLLNQESSGGGGPCHLVVDKAGKNVLAANYGGGSVCVCPITAD